jgi:hypothetical protein
MEDLTKIHLTPSQYKALGILRDTGYDNRYSAKRFAEAMWKGTKTNMFTSSKNTGNGSTKGKAAWLCGGSYLCKLAKKGWVYHDYWPNNTFWITTEGKRVFDDFKNI